MFGISLPAKRYTVKGIWKVFPSYLFDASAFALSVFLAFQLRFDGALPAMYRHPMLVALCIWTAVKLVAFFIGGVSGGYWRYNSIHEAVRIVWVNLLGSILGGIIIVLLLGRWGIPRSVYLLEWLVSCSVTLGGRVIARLVAIRKRTDLTGGARARTLIYGAGSAGLALVRELGQNQSLMCDVVGLIDDDSRKVGLTFHGKRVLGTGGTLAAIARKHAIKQVLIAIPTATGPQMARICKLAIDADVDYKMVPSLGKIIQDTDLGKQIREVALEDLLDRKPVQLDQDSIRERIEGKVIMVTGAAGSIGSEICRQVARFHPLALVGFDSAETPLFQIERELNSSFPHLAFYPEIGSITCPETLRHVMQNYRPAILYHAAAYKHVPLMEKHVFAAVEQ